jgi:hypothetical protein
MSSPPPLNPAARAEVKQAAREEDRRSLNVEGGAENLRAKNGKFAFPAPVIDWSSPRRHW